MGVVLEVDTHHLGLMVQVDKGGIGAKQVDTTLRIFNSLVMEVSTILLIKGNIAGDVVVSTDEDFDTKLGLLEPLDGLLEFGKGTLVREVSCVDQYVSRWQLGGLVMSIRYTDNSHASVSHDAEE